MPKSRDALRQGSADGLCGIYALLNFLRLKRLSDQIEASTKKDAFYWLLRAAEQESLLDAAHVWGGYYWYELQMIFNRLSRSRGLRFKAVSLGALSEAQDDPGLFALVELVESEGGGLVTCIYEGTHWILATEHDSGRVSVHDSAHDEAIQALKRNQKKSFWKEGVALLPSSSSLSRLKNA